MELAEAIEQSLAELGFPRENRQFHPHMTLARVRGKPPAELKIWLEQQTATPFGTIEVESVTLFQSELSAAGASHTVLATAALAEAV